MWTRESRSRLWKQLSEPWDLVIVGGGITGAGVLAEASRRGLKAVLLEGHDFGYGTSSRSSKLVHGGLRYLKQAQIMLTRTSVREREELLHGAQGLVWPLGFYVASLEGDTTSPWMVGLGLAVYDLMARKWAHTRLDARQLQEAVPLLHGEKLKGGYHFFDAQTDDTRLVMRVLLEAQRGGGTAVNYAYVTRLLRDERGEVVGVEVEDRAGELGTAEVRAKAVVNAAGVWADGLRSQLEKAPRLRAIRGSHLVFPHAKLPVPEAISLLHPRDGRAVFALPWMGVTLVGTTDVDHEGGLEVEPHISAAEVDYLMELLAHAFPGADVRPDDAIATYSGVRPVIDTGAADPSKESREHAIWAEDGLVTVTGGKLTTFRMMARQTLSALAGRVSVGGVAKPATPPEDVLWASAWMSALDDASRQRLLGLYGSAAPMVFHAAPADCIPVAGTSVLWSELRWAARTEGVVHLDDLLLRRTRLGLLLPGGAMHLLERIRAVVGPELEWSPERWSSEVDRYRTIWRAAYGPPNMVTHG